MAGTVYLKTNRFEVKLEGITFKTKEFESLCNIGFLFPDGKAWARKPIVGLDVMYHPRDPSVILLLLCFGLGCVILKFGAGEALPAGIHKFLADKRIHVVGFGIPEKFDLFPFEELGLTKKQSDIGYMAADILKDPKYKRFELDGLARKVLGVKRMVGLTEASSFERHEQIKCAICHLFVTTVIAMGLSSGKEKKKTDRFNANLNLNSLQLLAEGWFKLPKGKKRKQSPFDDKKFVHKTDNNQNTVANDNANDKNALVNPIVDVLLNAKSTEGSLENSASPRSEEKENAEGGSSSCDDNAKKPIKGILKCPSTTLRRSESNEAALTTSPSTPLSPSTETPPSPSTPTGIMLKRANSKGCNVSFKFH